MIGTIGNLFLEESDNIDYAIKNIGLFKTSQNPKWRYFTYLWLKSDLGSQFIHENRSGSTQEYISLGNLRSIIFYVESDSQVGEFNSVVTEIFKKIKSNQIQIRTLTALRDTLLPKLMSGEIRINQS
jgi:type I restriction enzyme S subunit